MHPIQSKGAFLHGDTPLPRQTTSGVAISRKLGQVHQGASGVFIFFHRQQFVLAVSLGDSLSMHFACLICLIILLVVVHGTLAINGQEEYSYSEFPSSLTLKEECGRENSDRPIYVCDPNRILDNDDARQLDVLIETVMNETECQCSADVCSQPASPGYRIAVALLRKMKLPESDDTDDEINDKLSLTLSEASHFAYYLLGKWKLGRCTDDVLILYSVKDGVIYTVTGDEAGRRLDAYTIADISMSRRPDLRRDVFKGLMLIVSDYKAVFLGLDRSLERKKLPPKYEAVIGGTQSIQYSTLSIMLLTIIIALMSTKF